MTEAMIALVPQYGLPVLFLTAFVGMLGVPVPSGLVLLAGGAFAASGDLPLAGTLALPLAGAVVADQIGFWVGRMGRATVLPRLAASPSRARQLASAQGFAARWGVAGVFLTRWLISPIGPYVNYAGGAAGLGWAGFSLASVTGETIWTLIYVGLGWRFAGDIVGLADLTGNLSLMLAGLAATAGLLALLRARIHRARRRAAARGPARDGRA